MSYSVHVVGILELLCQNQRSAVITYKPTGMINWFHNGERTEQVGGFTYLGADIVHRADWKPGALTRLAIGTKLC